MSPTDPLSEQQLQTLLTRTFLRTIHHFPETDSTNTKSLQLLNDSDSLETPCLVYAEVQTSGRGRGSNRWWSQVGSLTFSLIVDMQELGLTPEKQPQLSLLTGLALLKAGQFRLPRADFAVKWPNDVFLSGRKMAGILTEVPPHSPRHAVIGIGLNVNNQFAEAPPEIRETGISLSDLSGQTHSRLEILEMLMQKLDESFQLLSKGEPVLAEWSEYCLLSGKSVTIQAGPNQIVGVCRGIDKNGALLLDTNVGTQRILGGVVANWE